MEAAKLVSLFFWALPLSTPATAGLQCRGCAGQAFCHRQACVMARLYAAAAAVVLLLAACGHTARADTLDIGDLAGTGLPDVRPW